LVCSQITSRELREPTLHPFGSRNDTFVERGFDAG
jgi:hypothetical protein